MTRRIEFTVPDAVGEAYDEARGIAPMATWIKAVLDEKLNSPRRATLERDGYELAALGTPPPDAQALESALRDVPGAMKAESPGSAPLPSVPPRAPAGYHAATFARQEKLNAAKSKPKTGKR